MNTEVYCTLQMEGIHHWPGCPFEEVAYLRNLHRHVFHIKAHMIVTHSDRDVEFIMLKNQIADYLVETYADHTATNTTILQFGAMSCEMIARDLIEALSLSRCEVSEDGENGAIVYV